MTKNSMDQSEPSSTAFRLLVEGVLEKGLFILDQAGQLKSWNVGATRLTGYSASEVLGQPIYILFALQSSVAARLKLELSSFQELRAWSERGVLVRKDQLLVLVDLTVTPLFENNSHIGFGVAIREVTDLKRTKDALQLSEQRFRELADAIPQIVWTASPDGAVDFFNARAVAYSGVNLQELSGWSWECVIFPDDLPRVLRDWRETLRTGVSKDQLFRIRDVHGEYRWHVARQVASRGPDGKIVRWYGTCTDIDYQKKIEVDLQEHLARLEMGMKLGRAFIFDWFCESDRVQRSANSADILGLTDDATKDSGAEFAQTIHPEDRSQHVELVQKLRPTEPFYRTTYRIIRPDGQIVWLEDTGRGRFNEAGKLVQISGMAADISARKQLEAVAHKQAIVLERIAVGAPLREVLEEIVDLVEDQIPGCLCSILILSMDGKQLHFGAGRNLPTAYSEAIDGVVIGEGVGSFGTAAFRGEAVVVADIASDPLWNDYCDLALSHGLGACWSWPVFSSKKAKENAQIDQILGTFAIYHRDPMFPPSNLEAAIAAAADLAGLAIARERAIREIRESEERYGMISQITRSVTFGVQLFADGSSRIDWSRPHFGLLSGYTKEELQEMGWEVLFHPDDLASASMLFKLMLAGETARGELRIITKAKKVLIVLLQGRLLTSGPTPGSGIIIGGMLDITDFKAVEGALRESDDRFQQIVRTIDQAFWMTSYPGMQMLYVSPAAERVWGLSAVDMLNSPEDWTIGLVPEDREHVRQKFKSWLQNPLTDTSDSEYRVIGPEGGIRWVVDRATLIRNPQGEYYRVIGVAEDVTERKTLEAQFRQSQKMEAVGQLAGGVAHDFNNLLTVILGYSDLLLSQLSEKDAKTQAITAIRESGKRAAGLTSQLLAFSRKQLLDPVVLSLNEVANRSEIFVRRLTPENILVSIKLAASLPSVKADPAQLDQVILNLVLNACDAMPQGGELTIETSAIEVQESGNTSSSDLVPGSYVRLSISDTGYGMTEEIKMRMFDPFFTTKQVGKGTGLGLAVVHGVVAQSGGHIRVQSQEGVGTVFEIFFPAISGEMRPAIRTEGKRMTMRGTETILVAEDEAAVREIIRSTLKSQGYLVLEAENGQVALEMSKQHPGPIHLLLTDVVMPVMGGSRLADEMREQRPEILVVFMSGYTKDSNLLQEISRTNQGLLQKPFVPMALLHRVREVLRRLD